jgi:hypothetical protein
MALKLDTWIDVGNGWVKESAETISTTVYLCSVWLTAAGNYRVRIRGFDIEGRWATPEEAKAVADALIALEK